MLLSGEQAKEEFYKMGSLFAKPKKAKSRVTEQDKAILQLKQQRDRIRQYQRRIEQSLEKDRQMAKKCLNNGRRERAKLLLRKKKYQESLLANTDKQLENLEKMASDMEFAQVEVQVIDGLKRGNEALKQMHEILNIDDIERIMDETQEAVEKQREIDAVLGEMSANITAEDEEDILAELDSLEAEIEKATPTKDLPNTELNLPEVPSEELPTIDQTEPEKSSYKDKKTKAIALES